MSVKVTLQFSRNGYVEDAFLSVEGHPADDRPTPLMIHNTYRPQSFVVSSYAGDFVLTGLLVPDEIHALAHYVPWETVPQHITLEFDYEPGVAFEINIEMEPSNDE